MPTTLVWFRQDLRLADHPALRFAAERGAVVPVFMRCPEEEGAGPVGGARQWWLHQSLSKLAASLYKLGSGLILRQGPAFETLLEIAAEARADTVVWHRCYEPAAIARDKKVKRGLADAIVNHRHALAIGQLAHPLGHVFLGVVDDLVASHGLGQRRFLR